MDDPMPPVEALGLETDESKGVAPGAKVENALDVLFSEPIFDEGDLADE